MSNHTGLWGQETKYFHQLSPELVLNGASLFGQRLTGKLLPLNSLENRVYEVELAAPWDFGPGFSSQHLILKFYRPGRWTKEQILEEHQFLLELSQFEIPVVAPIEVQQLSLHQDPETQLLFALFPKVQGRLKDELIKDEIDQVGRLIGRIHNIGSQQLFKHRSRLHPDSLIGASLMELKNIAPVDYPSFQFYLSLLEPTQQLINPYFQQLEFQRLHGDFHRGNIVWTSYGPMAVDFDDCINGPIEQDLWLLFPGQDEDSLKDKERFLSAYSEMTKKSRIKNHLTELFRTMRMIHFNAWIGKRWEDHSFQRMFPQFTTPHYWDQQLIDLRTQMAHIQDLRTGIGFE
jgi:Ser/Thr protein kinase RdoA (MazF antagonist)